jgi:hypothetical protein
LGEITVDEIMMLELVRGVKDPELRERLRQVKNPTIDSLVGMAESWPMASDERGISSIDGARARKAVTDYNTGLVARCQQDRPQAGGTGSQWGDSHTRGRCPAWEAEISAAKGAQGNGGDGFLPAIVHAYGRVPRGVSWTKRIEKLGL